MITERGNETIILNDLNKKYETLKEMETIILNDEQENMRLLCI